jgi:hypothetical protein
VPALGASDGVAASIEQGIAQREYEASRNDQGLQAPNRAQNLRTYFEPKGIRVHDRTAPDSPELLSLRLASLGRAGGVEAIAPGEVVSDGARVEIRRPGLVEWYENGQRGLEQGFTLEARPDGEGDLWLELALDGATARVRRDELELRSAAGRRLRYSELHVRDAGGRALDARMELPTESRVRIVVADEGAAYPVTIDPLLSGTAETQLESDQAIARLGASVASAGDVNGDGYGDVIVGADGYDSGQSDEGAAFVFLGGDLGIADGTPATAHARLESDQVSAFLGGSVASAGT